MLHGGSPVPSAFLIGTHARVARVTIRSDWRTIPGVSDAAEAENDQAHGSGLLPADLTEADLASAPVLDSVDGLLVDGLSDAEDDAFAAALAR